MAIAEERIADLREEISRISGELRGEIKSLVRNQQQTHEYTVEKVDGFTETLHGVRGDNGVMGRLALLERALRDVAEKVRPLSDLKAKVAATERWQANATKALWFIALTTGGLLIKAVWSAVAGG